MNRNLGDTSLRRRRRAKDPMQAFDALPTPLRHWLSEAALPWSPQSVRKIWVRARAEGKSADETLQSLSELEARNLAKDRWATETRIT